MHAELPHYLTGGKVHAGDRVRYKENSATVVFVSDGEEGEYSPGYTDYLGHEPGIMLRDDDGVLTFLPEANEDLEFLQHKESR